MGTPNYEMNYLEKNTGKLPKFVDLILNKDFAGYEKRAEEWWSKGGIVPICWHTDVLTDSKSNTPENLNEMYNSDYLITLDKLPDWTK